MTKRLRQFSFQTRFAMHVMRRDMAKRLATALMMGAISWRLGHPVFATGYIGVIVLTEVLGWVLSRHIPDDHRRIGPLMNVMALTLQVFSVMAFLAPSSVLVSHGSGAMILGGFIWAFGVNIHVSNSFSAMPLFNWSMMIPSFATVFVLTWMTSRSDLAVSTTDEWLAVALMLVVYVANNVETLRKQADTREALNAAREELESRMTALEFASRHDGLTGMLNRRAFDEELVKLLKGKRKQTAVAVFVIDLDGFKPINDTYNHDAGDHVLREIATRLRAIAGESGIGGRVGGDEFAMAFPAILSDRAAVRLGKYIVAELVRPISYGERELQIGASVGVSLSTQVTPTVEAMCSAADQAMYRAKSQAGEKVLLYRPETDIKRPSLEDRRNLLAALGKGEIRPHYQPKVWLDTGQLFGFEALVRWHHPDRGVLMPAEFLPAINELGLQGDLLGHMAQTVLSDIDGILSDGQDPGSVSINVPEMALATKSGSKELLDIFARHPQASRHVTLEITEDVFIARSTEIIQQSIRTFRAKGLRVSLDDFGTGFASFQHLRTLEFDELKIDMSFVADLGQDRTTEILVAGFLTMAEGLGVAVIAEGIETQEQHAYLMRAGCRIGQGHKFGRAMPIDETRIHIAAESSRNHRRRTGSDP